jgi:tetratricopeptide (TPR) repeat protein
MKPDPARSAGARRAPLLGALAACLLSGGLEAQDADLAALWKDPTFRKQFVGSYGINAEIEPRVTPEEVKVLEKIQPLMGESLPKAESLLRKELEPDSSAILDFTLGSICFQQDKLDEALQHYQRAVEKFPSFRRAWRNLGLIYVKNGNHDAAIEAFTKMIELGGGDAYSYGLLGFAYASKEDYQAAEAGYRNALLLQPENLEWRLGLTRCVFKQDKFEDAAALLNVLIERHPENADFWLLQAHTYIGMKQPLKAAQNLEAMDMLGESTVDSLGTLGDIYVGENLLDFAERAYARALERDPGQPPARPLQAVEVLAGRGALDQAKRLAERIHAAYGEGLAEADRTKLLKLDARLSLAGGEGTAETAGILEQIIQLDPLDGEALLLLGQHYSRANEPDRAILYYERAESLPAFEAVAKTRHAQVLVGLSRYNDAIPLLRRAQEVAPREDVARYLEQVERIARARR